MGTSRWLLRWSVPMLVVGSATSDPYPRNPDLDILAYRYVLALSDSSDQIRMDATVEFGFLAGGRTRLSLDLVGRNDSGKGMVVDRVADSAGPLEFSHRDNRLDVALRRPGSAGERGAVSIRYHGLPAAALTIGANKFHLKNSLSHLELVLRSSLNETFFCPSFLFELEDLR